MVIVTLASVCTSACLHICNMITFESVKATSVFGLWVHLHGMRVKFVYEGHQVKVEVAAAKRYEITYFAM